MREHKQPSEYIAESSGIYQTGSTAPPKSYTGIITFFLSATIFICGISTIFSLMQVNFLQKLQMQTENQTCQLAFEKPPAEAPQEDMRIQAASVDPFWQDYHDLPQGIHVKESHYPPLQKGDIIICIDQQPVTDWANAKQLLSQYKPGDSVLITVYRNHKKINLKLTIPK